MSNTLYRQTDRQTDDLQLQSLRCNERRKSINKSHRLSVLSLSLSLSLSLLRRDKEETDEPMCGWCGGDSGEVVRRAERADRGQRRRRVTVNISTTWPREIHFGPIVSTGASVVIEWAVLANQ